MKEVKQDEQVGYACPLCRKFTAKDQLYALPIMNQLMEAITQSSATLKCGTCGHDKPTWRCMDCKENFCDTCRTDHNKFKALQHHKWQRFDGNDKTVIDDVVYCDVHSSEQVKIHCRDCKQLICLLCNETTHKTHTAETIEEALQQMLPIVSENQLKAKTLIQDTQISLAEAKQKKQVMKKMYDDIRKDVAAKYKEMTERLNEDHAALLKELDASEVEATGEHESHVKQLELKLQSQENVLSLSQSTLDTVQNISLLKALQSGILDSLKGTLHAENTAPTLGQTTLEFITKHLDAENMIGKFAGRRHRGRDVLEIACDELMTKKFDKQSEYSIDVRCRSFDIINNELWFIDENSNNIIIFSIDRIKKTQLKYDEMGKARTLAKFNDKALVSAQRGMFIVSPDQRYYVTKVFDGDCYDACVGGSLVYALVLDEQRTNKVIAFQYSTKCNSFAKPKSWQIADNISDYWSTIQATSDCIFVAHCHENVIQQYTMDGQLVTTHGRLDSRHDALHWPLLTGSDALNNVLLANYASNQISILKADGNFYSVPVSDIGGGPMCARIYMNRLYVA